MKKILALALTAVVALSVGCSSAPEPESTPGTQTVDFPGTKVVNLIVPFSAGGSSDVGARILQPYLEKNLGTTVNIVNLPGASGWVGWEKLLSEKADGYNISMINLPTIYSGYLDKSLGRDKSITDFQMLANHVSDFSVLATKVDDDRFTDVTSFIEYAKNTEVTIATSGAGSDDDILVNKLKKAMDLKITAVPMSGASEAFAAVLGGHVDCFAGNVGDVLTPMKNNEINTIVVFAEERSNLIPEIPTWNESNFGAQVTNSSDRGFAIKAGTPDEVVTILSAAFEAAINDIEQVEKMTELGLEVNYMNADDAGTYVIDEEKVMIDMADVMGWN